MILPETGSVVIIDDRPEEALPIISALSKNGIACTYFKGYKQNELPTNQIHPVRLLILDLQLFDGVTDAHTIATNLIHILKKIISETNGPYLLLLWSKKENLYAEALKEAVKNPKNKIVPAFIVSLSKLQCLEQEKKLSEEDAIVSEIIEELSNAFEEEDLKIIKETLSLKLPLREDSIYKAKDNAINIIEEKIKDELKKAGVFHLFVIWENLVKQSGADTVNSISSTLTMDELWENNMKDIIKRMAKARTGLNTITDKQALTESLAIFNNSFIDDLESKIRRFEFPESVNLDAPFLIAEKNASGLYGIKEVKEQGKDEIKVVMNHDGIDSDFSVVKIKLHNLYSSLKEPEKSVAERLGKIYAEIPYAINTSLHLEMHPSNELIPGNVYKVNVSDEKRKALLLTYLDKIESPINDYHFIELEVSPICDYAQAKWKKSRLLPGIIYPANLRAKSKFDNLYNVDPTLLIDGKPNRIVFDFHLFKASDKEVVEKRKIVFRLKKELLMDIIVKLSSHVNRAGISYVS